MCPKKRDHPKRTFTSSNHSFSEDMLVFQGSKNSIIIHCKNFSDCRFLIISPPTIHQNQISHEFFPGFKNDDRRRTLVLSCCWVTPATPHTPNTPQKTNMEHNSMEVWKIMFLSKWVICMFHVNLPRCMTRRVAALNFLDQPAPAPGATGC